MKKILFVLLLILATSAHAFVKVAEVFTSNMVLQQEKNIRVWGTADAGEQVKVMLGKQKTMTTADALQLHMQGHNSSYYQPLATLRISLPQPLQKEGSQLPYTDYRRELSLDSAVASVTYKMGKT